MPVVSGLLLAVSLPPRPYPGVVWAALIPLLLVLRESRGWRSFASGWGTGSIYYLLSVYWVGRTMELYGHLPSWLSSSAALLLAVYMGLFVGGWAWLAAGILRRHRWLAPVWTGGLWAALEWLRTHLFGGFGWAHLGYSQVTTPAILQVVDLVGVFGLSALVVGINVVLAETVHRLVNGRTRTVDPQLLFAVLVVLLCASYGLHRISSVRAARPEAELPVALVQGNIPQGEKWDPSKRRKILEIYLKGSEPAKIGDARLVVWPEAALPYLLQVNPGLKRVLGNLARRNGADLLFGGLYRPPGERIYSNSAFAISATGEETGRYDKNYLVPFGEFVPLGRLLAFVRSITSEIGDFRAGSEPRLLSLAGIPAGCAICFEVSYPELVRAFAGRGARMLVAITNDAWFGNSIAPRQHLYIAAVRCVEQRIPMVRCANNGITAVIDVDGRILEEIPQFQRATLATRVPLRDLGPTLYSRLGEGWLVVLLALWLLREGQASARSR